MNYFVPATGPSDIGAFVGHVLHGGSGGILQRKISANVGSLTTTIYSPIVPLAVIAAALVLAWPDRFRLAALGRAYGALPLLRPGFDGHLAGRGARLVRGRLGRDGARGRDPAGPAAHHRHRVRCARICPGQRKW